jgi:DNA repair protein RecO (recombination protein O)
MAASRTFRIRAIVLSRTKLGETDLILTLLSQDGSQVRAVAKGARKPGGRLAARCELFCESDFLIARGRTLGIVSEAALVDAHDAIRGDLDRVSAASAICEIASLSCFEDATDPFLFPITQRALLACEQAEDVAHLDLACAAYAFKVLAHGGWRPELSVCIECGDPAPTRFSVVAGGLLCESCSRDVEGAEDVTPSQIAWLRALLGLTFDELLGTEIQDTDAAWLASLAHSWASTHLDARLRAWEFMLSVE